jgi:hypothetical protein
VEREKENQGKKKKTDTRTGKNGKKSDLPFFANSISALSSHVLFFQGKIFQE